MWSLNQKRGQDLRNASSQSHPRPNKWETLGRGTSSLKSSFWLETLCSQVLGDPSESAVSWDRLKAEDPGCGVLGSLKRKSRHMSPWDTCLCERDHAQSDKCKRRGGWDRSDGRGTGAGKTTWKSVRLWALLHSIPSKDKRPCWAIKNFSTCLNHMDQEFGYKLRTQGLGYRRSFLLHSQATLCRLPEGKHCLVQRFLLHASLQCLLAPPSCCRMGLIIWPTTHSSKLNNSSKLYIY